MGTLVFGNAGQASRWEADSVLGLTCGRSTVPARRSQSIAAHFAKAVDCLKSDRDVLLQFYDFPAEHWVHLRTTNPIESTFATVRLRTDKTKGCGSRTACLTMVFKLAQSAERHWRALNGSALISDIIAGVQFVDGVRKEAA